MKTAPSQIVQVRPKPPGLANADVVAGQISVLLSTLTPEIRSAIALTSDSQQAMEVSLFFLLDSPTVRVESTVSNKSQVDLSGSPGNQRHKKAPPMGQPVLDLRFDHALANTSAWVQQVLQRVVAERISSVELILFFKQARLIGLREVLNTKIAAPVL